MSTPLTLRLPEGTTPTALPTRAGDLAGLIAEPVARAGHQDAERGVVVLVPGFTGSKEDFLPILDLLAEAGWRVCAVDLRGQYHSGGPAAESAYTLQGWAEDLADIVAGFGSARVHLVGHSFGGLVARAAVLAGTPAASLTLLCSGPAALPPERLGAIPALVSVLPAMPLETVWQAKESIDRAAGWAPPSDEVLDFLRERFTRSSPGCMRAMGVTLMTAPDLTEELAGAGVPLQVVYGEHDEVWPIDLQAEMAHRLGVTPVVIPGAAHSPAVEAPMLLVQNLMDFWSEVSQRGAAGRTDT